MSNYPLTPCFELFLERISLKPGQKEQLNNAQIALRRKLNADKKLSEIVETTFIQGSYGRGTALRPRNGKISDIDIVVVTKLDMDEYTPKEILGLFKNFSTIHYKNGMGRTQNHSMGIRLQHAYIDVVPAIAPLLMQPGIFGEKNTTSILYNYIFSSVARECAIRLALTGESVGRVPEWKRGNLSTLEGIANSKEKWKAMRGYICRSLHAMLKEFNLSYREPSKNVPLGIYYENDKNEKLAGLVGETFGNWLCIKYLFVSEDLRGQGIGKKIMESAEQVARKRGCKFAFVDTFSFQAQDSIRNLGSKRCLC